jgi:AcrR family transcriptional regulator
VPIAEPDPRVAHTRSVVLCAATELLAEAGSAGFTVDGVVARSGVAKTTIYRHWPTKDDLLMAAVDCFGQREEVPDTGALRGDLVALLSRLGRELATEQWSMSLPAVIERAEHDSEVAEHFQTIVRHKSAPLRLILERGRDRGEIGKDVDLDLAQAVLSGGLFYRRLVTHQRTSNRQVEAIVDTVLDGLTV